MGGGGGGGTLPALAGTSSSTGGVMEFGMSHRIKSKEKNARISMKEVCRNLDGPSKIKELLSYVVRFDFSRPKVAQTN